MKNWTINMGIILTGVAAICINHFLDGYKILSTICIIAMVVLSLIKERTNKNKVEETIS